VIWETGSGCLPLETARWLDPKGSMWEDDLSNKKSPRSFRRLMKVGGFFVLLVRHQ
jgi:hypothetical protein